MVSIETRNQSQAFFADASLPRRFAYRAVRSGLDGGSVARVCRMVYLAPETLPRQQHVLNQCQYQLRPERQNLSRNRQHRELEQRGTARSFNPTPDSNLRCGLKNDGTPTSTSGAHMNRRVTLLASQSTQATSGRSSDSVKAETRSPAVQTLELSNRVLFNVLKNDCQIEELQLGTIERLGRTLALFLVVAWRVTYLMRLGRTCPDLDADLFFDPSETSAAHLLAKTRMPVQHKLSEVLRLVAGLGGFLARKGDGEPGAETIWKGFTKVHIAAETMRLLRYDGDADISVQRHGLGLANMDC